jgi:hypothetical protein
MLRGDELSKFVYMRISKDELHTAVSWCEDMDLKSLCGTPHYKVDRGKPTKGDICLTGFDDDGKKIYERVIGKCVSLENSAIYKSGRYPEFKIMVFEEYIKVNCNPSYEKNYVFHFNEIVKSFFRREHNKPIKIFCLANNLKNIPLFEANIKDQIKQYDGDELRLFKNPLKIKLFYRSDGSKVDNSFSAYLRGEIMETDEFKPIRGDFVVLFKSDYFALLQHKVLTNKILVVKSVSVTDLQYKIADFMRLKFFIQGVNRYDFYYDSTRLENEYSLVHHKIIIEATDFLITRGYRVL